MERSEIRGGVGEIPDCAALHPGYALLREHDANALLRIGSR